MSLKPCICGFRAEAYPDFHGEGFMTAVGCTECDLAVVHVHCGDPLEVCLESLAKQWNKRMSSIDDLRSAQDDASRLRYPDMTGR